MTPIIDPLFRVETIARTPNPQQLAWLAAHQCVSDQPAVDCDRPTEANAGEYVVKHLLKGNRGHYSPLEAPQISFNVIDLPHSVMQQIRTHRIGWHFSVQSFRYTSDRIVSVAKGELDPERFVYLRPVGTYNDRQGKRYDYTAVERADDLNWALLSAIRYAKSLQDGYSEEHARGGLPFDVRQSWVMSANVRSLMHMFDLRSKADAQLECQQLCELLWPHFEEWVPAIAEWYKENRLGKARLAP